MNLILLCLMTAVYLDIFLFKYFDRRLFTDLFRMSLLKAVLGCFFILIVLIFSDNRSQDVSCLVLLFVLPMYLLRRNRFVKTFKWDKSPRAMMLLSGALGVIIVWIFGAATFSLFTEALMGLFPKAISEMGDLILSAAFSFFLIISLVYRASTHFSDQGFLTNVGLRKKETSWKKIIIFPAIAGFLFAFIAAYLGVARQVQPQTPLGDVLETTQSVGLIVIFLILAIGIAPLIEEIVFRGYFFYVVKEWIGSKKAVFIIALTFGFLHVGQYWGDWLAITMVAILGFVLTILRAWSKSTIASVVAHYVYNGSVTIIPIIILAVTNPAYLDYKVNYPIHDAQTKETLLKKSIAAQPDLSDAYNDLAWLYAQEGKNLDEALQLIDKALQYAPDYPAYLDTKAEVLEKLGRYEEARPIRDQLKGKLP